MEEKIELRKSVDRVLCAICDLGENAPIKINEKWRHDVNSLFSNMVILQGELASCNLISTWKNRPVNPKTGKYFTKRSQKYKEWFAGLSRDDQNWLADREANEWL